MEIISSRISKIGSGLMPRKKPDHLHKYQRTILGRRNWLIYRCMVPGCTHYIDADLILNRLCECWRCGNAMAINKRAALLAKPHCDDCVRSPKKDEVDKLTELFT